MRSPGLLILRWVVAVIGLGVIAHSVALIIAFGQVHRQVERINDERTRNILMVCADTNARHDGTIRALNVILARQLKTAGPRERARLRASRENTVLLIEALAPKRDCVRLARQQVGR